MQHIDLETVARQQRHQETDADQRPDAHVQQRPRPEDDTPVEMLDRIDETAIGGPTRGWD
jgi:hypothetical protein